MPVAVREALPPITAGVEVEATAPRGQTVRAMGAPEETELPIQYQDRPSLMAGAAGAALVRVDKEEAVEPAAAAAEGMAATPAVPMAVVE